MIQEYYVISRAVGANQTAFTGLQPLIPDSTDNDGNPIYNQAIIEDANHTTQDDYVIPLVSGVRAFLNNIVPDGITTSEVAAAVQTAPVFQNIDTNVTALRTNRLLGIRPQGPSSGGDFSV